MRYVEAEVMTSRESVEALREFLGPLEGVTVLACDDLQRATKGHVAFYEGDDGEERTICFQWRFAKVPMVKVYDRREYEEEERLKIIGMLESLEPDDPARSLEPPTFEELIEECMGEGWVKCDDPQNRRIGFAKYAELTGVAESSVLLFDLLDIKGLDKGLRDRLMEWRGKRKAGD